MKKSKLTKWFGRRVKPSMPGWYQRNYESYSVHVNNGLSNDYWNGKIWLMGTPSGEMFEGAQQELKWRGLAEKP